MKEFLNDLVLDRTSLVSIDSTYPLDPSKNSTTVILKNETLDKVTGKLRGTYLGDVLKELPHGIINKTETGIGATTLELKSKRNSIIVENLKVTASSKAKHHGAFYVGSPTDDFPNAGDVEDLKDYISDVSVEFKKIIVVADSFPKVIKAIGPNVYTTYFLLLDEIDSFQKDSTYRSSMEICIDYFKNFLVIDDKNCALTTATMLSFTDKTLADLSETVFKYETPTERPISLYQLDEIDEYCFDTILKLTKEHSGEKIVIAYNSVGNCCVIAKKLVSDGHYDKSEVAILCGKSDRNLAKVDDYFEELTKGILPRKVNFMTSAYFTGFDLGERYHLINVSNGRKDYMRLSASNLLQISGRCRVKEGLFSNSMIYKLAEPSKRKPETQKALLGTASAEIMAIGCISKSYEKLPEKQKEVLSQLTSFSRSHRKPVFKYVRTNYTGEFVISYFNIDAEIENQRVRNIYEKKELLIQDLTEALFKVTEHKVTTTTVFKSIKKPKEDKIDVYRRAYSKIKEYFPLLDDFIEENSKLVPLEKSIYKLFQSYNFTISHVSLMNAIRESIQPIYGAKKANLSRFNKLSNKINHFLVDESSLLKRSIRHHLRIGKQFNTAEKKTAVFNILADSKIPTAGINIDILFETWVKFKVTTRTGVKAGMTPENIVEVLNYNPLNLEYNESPFMLRSGL